MNDENQKTPLSKAGRVARLIGVLLLVGAMAFFALKYTGFNKISLGNIFYAEPKGGAAQSNDD
jgi:hypothetical protein